MTKMQTLAKTTLTVLGIYAVLTLCNSYPGSFMYRREQPAIMPEILFLSAFTVLATLAVYFIIFNNTTFSKRIAGPGEIPEPRKQIDLLGKSLRIGLVFTGLMLLPRSIPTLTKTPKMFLLIGSAIDDIVISKRYPRMLILSYSEWFRNTYDFLKAMLALYLICGAPHFIRWQLKHTLCRKFNIDQTEIPNSSIANSERAENE